MDTNTKVYLVYPLIKHEGCCGHYGIFSTREKAEKAVETLIDSYYRKEDWEIVGFELDEINRSGL